MRIMTRAGSSMAVALAVATTGHPVVAQDADLQAQIEAFQQQYEQDVADQDWAKLATLFAEDVTFLPPTGGTVEGRSGVQSFYEQAGITATDIKSTRAHMLDDHLLFDEGIYTLTMHSGTGDTPFQGEYVAVSEVGESGVQIKELVTFPVRQPLPDQP